jgi:hypothetical protein
LFWFQNEPVSTAAEVVLGLLSIGRCLLIIDSSDGNVCSLASTFTGHSLSLAVHMVHLQMDVHQLLLLVMHVINKHTIVSNVSSLAFRLKEFQLSLMYLGISYRQVIRKLLMNK